MTYNDILCVGMCPMMRPVRVAKKQKKKLSCFQTFKLAICPDHPCRCSPLKFSMQGRDWKVVIYCKFYENQ